MKKITSDISVIIPVHVLTDETKILFSNALRSVEQQLLQPEAVLIVVPKGGEVFEYLKTQDFGTIASIVSVVENDGETDFASQINFGVAASKTEWVSILELDDEYSKIWLKNVEEYKKAYSEVGIFLPIIVNTDGEGSFIGFGNEAVWANSFSDVLGLLDFNALLTYQNFNTDGFAIKKSLFEEFGGFKSSIKLTFIYEFLLRMTFKDVKVMVIPKFGYKHMNQRVDSLFAMYTVELDPIEQKWWLSQAKKEYYFNQDRKITYESQNQ